MLEGRMDVRDRGGVEGSPDSDPDDPDEVEARSGVGVWWRSIETGRNPSAIPKPRTASFSSSSANRWSPALKDNRADTLLDALLSKSDALLFVGSIAGNA